VENDKFFLHKTYFYTYENSYRDWDSKRNQWGKYR
jgi:hypothetical protein